jgi:tetratricopeptide (TPR) repeat protein
MDLYVKVEQQTVSFASVKALLQYFGYQPERTYEWNGVKLLHPWWEHETRENSLTDTQDVSQQLRFFVKDRTQRHLVKIAHCLLKDRDAHIHIVGAKWLDEGSKLFFEASQQLGLIQLTLLYEERENMPMITYTPEDEERRIHALTVAPRELDAEEKQWLYQSALRYIGCGDAWTGERILTRLFQEEQNADYGYYLGIAYTQLEKTLLAEYYLHLSKQLGQKRDVVSCNYVLSMLYARHHPSYFLSLEKAERLLQEAYQVLSEFDPEEKEVTFQKVFNRNGYALILFRRGEIAKAIRLLQQGIQTLTQYKDAKAALHQSVLVYNLAQCYMKAREFERAIEQFRRLIDLDPYYPENHLEMARCLIEMEKWSTAIEHLQQAKRLDPYIAETYSLLGYVYLQLDQLQQSQHYYEQAYQLSLHAVDTTYDYAYTLSESDQYDKSWQVLKRLDMTIDNPELLEDVWSLQAECLCNLNQPDRALQVLQEGLQMLPHSAKIKENESIVRNISI